MVAINLTQPTLHNPAAPDGADLVRLAFVGDREFPDELDGQVRTYANGARRLVRRAGRFRGVGTSYYVTPAQLATLKEWQGQVVLYRDGLGTRLWVVYLVTTARPSADGRRWTVPLDLQQVSYTEAV